MKIVDPTGGIARHRNNTRAVVTEQAFLCAYQQPALRVLKIVDGASVALNLDDACAIVKEEAFFYSGHQQPAWHIMEKQAIARQLCVPLLCSPHLGNVYTIVAERATARCSDQQSARRVTDFVDGTRQRASQRDNACWYICPRFGRAARQY